MPLLFRRTPPSGSLSAAAAAAADRRLNRARCSPGVLPLAAVATAPPPATAAAGEQAAGEPQEAPPREQRQQRRRGPPVATVPRSVRRSRATAASSSVEYALDQPAAVAAPPPPAPPAPPPPRRAIETKHTAAVVPAAAASSTAAITATAAPTAKTATAAPTAKTAPVPAAATAARQLGRQQQQQQQHQTARPPPQGGPASANPSSSPADGGDAALLPLVEWEGNGGGAWRLRHYDGPAASSAARALAARLRAGIAAERAAEAEALARLYAGADAARTLERLRRDGAVLADLVPSPVGTLYGQQKWAVTAAAGKRGGTLPPHRFRAGDAVLLSPMWAGSARGGGGGAAALSTPAAASAVALDATVLELSKDRVVLALDNAAGDALATRLGAAGGMRRPLWRVDRSPRDVAAQRQLEAVARLESGGWALPDARSPSGGDAFETLVRAALVGCAEAVVGGGGRGGGGLTSPAAAAAALERVASTPPPWVRDAPWRARAVALLAAQPGLNDSQRAAVAVALTRTLTLWQGPPGTGKTRTCLALIEVLVRSAEQADDADADADAAGVRAGSQRSNSNKSSSSTSGGGGFLLPVLAVADTNAAADNLVAGLAARGLRVVRVGGAARVRPALRHLSLEAQAEQTPLGERAAEGRARSRALFAQARHLAAAAAAGGGRQQRVGRDDDGDGDDQDDDEQEEAAWRRAWAPPRYNQGGAAAAAAPPPPPSLLETEARREWGRAERLARAAQRSVLEHAQVVCATLSASGDAVLVGGGGGGAKGGGFMFRAVVVDEATQATEPATLVPLTKGAQMVVLAGDPRQLPPTVVSREALLPPARLGVTLFDRLSTGGGGSGGGGGGEGEEDKEEGDGGASASAPSSSFPSSPPLIVPRLLNRQYRMHPALSLFPSRQFYGGRLRDGVRAADRPAPRGVAWPNPRVPAVMLCVEGGEGERRDDDDDDYYYGDDDDGEEDGGSGGGNHRGEGRRARRAAGGNGGGGGRGGGSYRNEAEGRAALRALHALLRGGDVRSVAVLSPYRGQVRLLERLLRAPAVSGWLERTQRHLERQQEAASDGQASSSSSSSSASAANGLDAPFSATPLVTVSSVDGFQGREADAVVLSVVRSNGRGAVGFCADPRRLNVAISRARRGLVVCCSERTLRAGGGAEWGAFLDWAEEQRVVVRGGGGRGDGGGGGAMPWPDAEPRWDDELL